MEKWLPIINHAALESSALCLAIFHIEKPELVFSNKAFRHLSGKDPVASLKNPDFGTLVRLAEKRELTDRPLKSTDQPRELAGRPRKSTDRPGELTDRPRELTDRPVFDGMMTLGEDPGSYTTINARVFVEGKEILIAGEIDLDRITEQNRRMVELNMETSNLQRQLTKEKVLLENALQELKKANADLAILNREKNRFLNITAHDLRNPISTAISIADILNTDKDSFSEEEQQGFLESISERLHFSLRLMTELLDVSKIESGSLELNLEKSDYIRLVRKTVHFNQLVGGYKDIRIRAEYSLKELMLGMDENKKELMLRMDENKIEQVLNNLISNAIKFSHKGSEITVTVEVQNDRVITSVIDQGIGINSDELSMIFQPFQKSSSRPTAGESSTGLGLAISKRIIEDHGGTIDVKSRKDQGSVFSFTIPMDL